MARNNHTDPLLNDALARTITGTVELTVRDDFIEDLNGSCRYVEGRGREGVFASLTRVLPEARRRFERLCAEIASVSRTRAANDTDASGTDAWRERRDGHARAAASALARCVAASARRDGSLLLGALRDFPPERLEGTSVPFAVFRREFLRCAPEVGVPINARRLIVQMLDELEDAWRQPELDLVYPTRLAA